MAQLYYTPISINSGQVPSTQTDFPVLVSQTDNRFKTIANGGHVANSNGFDIRPYTDTTLGTAIAGYELERYNATTGEVIMWVKVSSLSSSTTPIVLGYGDTSLTTDGSSTTTWSNGFIDGFHLADGTTLNLNSFTGLHNGTNHGATATTGQIDGAGSFGTSKYITFSSVTIPHTMSAWVKPSSFPNTNNGVLGGAGSGANVLFGATSAGKVTVQWGLSGTVATGTTVLSTAGTWYYIAATYDATAGPKVYLNGVQEGTSTDAGFSVSASITMGLGAVNGSGTWPWNGIVDEARASSVTRSQDWITTEYNNQNAPGTFETLGTEVAVATSTGNMFLLFP